MAEIDRDLIESAIRSGREEIDKAYGWTRDEYGHVVIGFDNDGVPMYSHTAEVGASELMESTIKFIASELGVKIGNPRLTPFKEAVRVRLYGDKETRSEGGK